MHRRIIVLLLGVLVPVGGLCLLDPASTGSIITTFVFGGTVGGVVGLAIYLVMKRRDTKPSDSSS